MSEPRAYPRAYARPTTGRPNRAAEVEVKRSHAAIPVAVVLAALGLYLGQYSILLPGLFGLALLWAGVSFLSTRLNPLSPHFYLTRKPSWTAVGVVFLLGIGLLWGAYLMWTHGYGPLLPRALGF
ncbi:MAG TPA: hypothetical protein VEH57_06050 [Thermoplasmata archaeon]|nr:hypothetical protein [Thermoplasmata archaeon]